MKTDELMEMLRDRHEPAKGSLREWAFFQQVRSEAWNARTADAIAVNLWQSRGQAIHGFEVKVSRTDWLKELKSPEKADVIATYCDYWWLVIGDSAILKEGELPDGWGLLCPTSTGKLRATRVAEKREVQPLTRTFLVEILRAAYSVVTPQQQLEREYHRGYKAGQEAQAKSGRNWKEQYEKLTQLIQGFEKTAGVSLRGFNWNGRNAEEAAAALRLVLRGEDEAVRLADRLKGLKDQAERIAQDIDSRLKGLEPVS